MSNWYTKPKALRRLTRWTQPWAANQNPVGLQQNVRLIIILQGFRSTWLWEGQSNSEVPCLHGSILWSCSNNIQYVSLTRPAVYDVLAQQHQVDVQKFPSLEGPLPLTADTCWIWLTPSGQLIHTGSNLCQLDSCYIPDLTCSAGQLRHTRSVLHQPDS